MPLSKPVRKQQILLPSSKNFLLLPNDAKEDILKRLTIDNLINYIEFIVGIHQHESDECFKLEQIVEDEIRLNSIASDEDSFISNWIEKNANRVPDLEANLLDHGNVYGKFFIPCICNWFLINIFYLRFSNAYNSNNHKHVVKFSNFHRSMSIYEGRVKFD